MANYSILRRWRTVRFARCHPRTSFSQASASRTRRLDAILAYCLFMWCSMSSRRCFSIGFSEFRSTGRERSNRLEGWLCSDGNLGFEILLFFERKKSIIDPTAFILPSSGVHIAVYRVRNTKYHLHPCAFHAKVIRRRRLVCPSVEKVAP